jgi:hypothetical protein
VEENRTSIKTIVDVLLLTATQNIAQGSHRESDDSHNKVHFLTIWEEISKHDPLIEKMMNACVFGYAELSDMTCYSMK